MNRFLLRSLLVFASLMLAASATMAATYTTVQNGNWTSGATWGGSAPPSTLGATDVVNIRHTVNYNTGTSLVLENGAVLRIEPQGLIGTTPRLDVPTNINVEIKPGATMVVDRAALIQRRFVGGGNSGTPQSGTLKNEGTLQVSDSTVEFAQDWLNSGGTRSFVNGCLITGQNFKSDGGSDTLVNSTVSIGWHGSGNFSVADGNPFRIDRARVQLAGTSGNFEFNSGAVRGSSGGQPNIDYITLKNQVTGVVGSGKIVASSSITTPDGLIDLDAYCAATYEPNGKFTGTQTSEARPSCPLTTQYFPCLAGNPELSLTKTILSGNPYAAEGDVIQYQLVATNTGNLTLRNVAISDPLLGTLSCSLPAPVTLGVNESLTCTGSLKVSAAQVTAGSIVNVASAAAIDPSDNPVTASATATAQLGNGTTPDLRLSKANASPNLTAGSTASYTLTVTNVGTAASSGTITVVDVLPTGLTVQGATPNPFTTGSWSCGYSGQVVTCTTAAVIGVPNGTSAIVIPVDVSSTLTGQVTNRAQVGGGNDPDKPTPNGTTAGNCSPTSPATSGCATSTDTVLGANLSLAKSNGTNTVAAGSTTVYTLTVTNSGTAATSGTITVADQLPSGLSIAPGPVTLLSGAPTWSCSAAGQVITCTSTTTIAASGGTSAFSFRVNVDGTASGTVVNRAQVAGGGDPGKTSTPTPGNCTANDTPAGCAIDSDPVDRNADLSIQKNGPATVPPNSAFTYTLTVVNNGIASADGATVTDPVPAQFAVGSAFCTSAAGGAVCPVGNLATGQDVNFTIPTLPSGGSVVITISVTAPTGGSYTNTATVAPPDGTNDPFSGNNQSSVTTTVGTPPPVADLAVFKTGTTRAATGDALTYTIVVVNAGPGAADGATFGDDTTTPLSGVTWTCVAGGGAVCPAGNGTGLPISQTVATFPMNGILIYTVTAIAPIEPETFDNVAEIDPPDGVVDPDPSNNTSTVTTEVVNEEIPRSDISTSKVGPANVAPGGTVTYTLIATNNGPASGDGATITDLVPAALTNVSATACVAGSSAGVVCGTATVSGQGNPAGSEGWLVTVPMTTFPVASIVVITVTGTAPQSGAFVNASRVFPPEGYDDSNPGNNIGGPVITNVLAPSLTANFSVLPPAVAAGGSYNGTLQCRNVGSSATTGSNCVPALPSGAHGSITNVVCTALPGSTNTAWAAGGGGTDCTFTYNAPGTAGGTGTAVTVQPVNFVGTASADTLPDAVANGSAPIVDALNDTANGPGGTTGASTNVGSNDVFPTGATFSILPGPTTCAGTAGSFSPATSPVAFYDIPASGSCVVAYQVCHPSPNGSVCDNALLTVSAVATTLGVSVNTTPAIAPGGIYPNQSVVCTNTGATTDAINMNCAVTLDGPGSISALSCPGNGSTQPPGGAITCTFTYTAPGSVGGASTFGSPNPVTFTGTATAANAAQQQATQSPPVVDAVNDATSAAASTASTLNVASNDRYPPGSTFSLRSGSTCASPSVTTAGVAGFTAPAGGTCTVNYTLCAPSPATTVCDEAVLTVTAVVAAEIREVPTLGTLAIALLALLLAGLGAVGASRRR